MLVVSPRQLGAVERLAVDRNQPSPGPARRVLTHFERLHRPDRHLPEHRDIDVATLLDVVEIHRLGIFASNDFSYFFREGIEVRRRLTVARDPRAREEWKDGKHESGASDEDHEFQV